MDLLKIIGFFRVKLPQFGISLHGPVILFNGLRGSLYLYKAYASQECHTKLHRSNSTNFSTGDISDPGVPDSLKINSSS